ncbi:conserved exported hypothetical protein [Methylocella tundrae]|uniref:Porin n=2 Tax=Methylocella tundrae TaxID=227605 RepID=A0A8B6M144_METTU|nr:conserved exported hypothetical protein [Methylocella tundrae]
MANRIGRSRSRRRGAYMAMAGVMATVLMGVSAARADVTDELLDQLKSKGVLTKAEYAKLKQRHAAEVAAKHAPGPTGPTGGNGRYVTSLDKGIGFHIPGTSVVTKDNGVVTVGDVDVKLTGALVFFGAEAFKTSYTGTAGIATGPFVPGGFPPAPIGVGGGVVGGSPYNNSNAIRAGLLPSNVVLSLATNQMGWDLGFTAGAYFGGNNVFPGAANANGAGSPIGLGTPGIDLRQVFGTIGTPEYGTLKIGRDLGLFGGDAILNDFTLFGVGTPAGNAAPGNTSLGRIGLGYVYADWIPQITYTTPVWNGFTASVGMFTPLDAINTTDTAAVGFALPGYGPSVGFSSGTMTAHDQPQFQGKIKYVGQFTPDVKLTAWADGITQLQRVEAGDAVVGGFVPGFGYTSASPGQSVRSVGVDGGVRVDWGGFSAVGYGYWGSALGTTGLFYAAVSPNGQARKSSGFYGEAEYTFWDRWTLGGSFGASYLEANSFDYTQSYVPWMVRSNQSWIGFTRYKLTDWVAFQAEFIQSRSISQSAGSAKSNAIVGGTTFFF